MLELSEILILVETLHYARMWIMYREKEKDSKRESKKWVSHRARLSALASWLVYVWRIRVTGSPSYATRSVTLILTVSIGWQETFTEMDSQTFISNSLWPPARRAEANKNPLSKICLPLFSKRLWVPKFDVHFSVRGFKIESPLNIVVYEVFKKDIVCIVKQFVQMVLTSWQV